MRRVHKNPTGQPWPCAGHPRRTAREKVPADGRVKHGHGGAWGPSNITRPVFALLAATLALAAPPPWADGELLTLRLLGTTDLHTHLVDYDYYKDAADSSLGLARTASLIKTARSEAKNVLLFDSGDTPQGKPVADDQRFVVATNDYRAERGGNFPGLDGKNVILEAQDTNQQLVLACLQDRRTIDPSADGNWSFAPLAGPVEAVFESAPAAQELVAGRTRYLGPGDNGFARYAIDLR
jgi:hypothetical protein